MLIRILACFCFAVVLAMPAIAKDRVVAAHYPPLMVYNSPDRPGYAVEIMQEAARRAGREIEISFLPFERAILEVQTGRDTLMPALFKGKARDDLFHWIIDIQRAELRFATLGPAVNDLDAARALRSIVLEQGTTGDVLLSNLGFTNLTRLQDPHASAQMLASGRVDAWFLAQSNMERVWRTLGSANPLTFGDLIHSVPIAMVASPDLPPAISAAYRDAVEMMKADGTLDAIINSYEMNDS